MLTFKPRAMLRAIFIRSRFPKRSPILLSTPACFRRNWTSCCTIIKISISVTFLCNDIRNNSGIHLYAILNLYLSPFDVNHTFRIQSQWHGKIALQQKFHHHYSLIEGLKSACPDKV